MRLRKKYYNLFCILIIIICIVAGIFSFTNIQKEQNKRKVQTKEVFTYDSTGTLGYKIYLLDNEFYEEEYLEEDQSIVYSLIDKIKVNFDYQFAGSLAMNVKNNYEVTAKIKASYTDNKTEEKIIWSKEYPVKEPTKNDTINVKDFIMNDTFDIDYQQFKTIADTYRDSVGIPVDSILDIAVKINYDCKVLPLVDRNYASQEQMHLTIPLSEAVVNIEKQELGNDSGNLIEKIQVENANEKALSISIVIVGLSIFLTLTMILLLLKRNRTDKSLYIQELERIMKSYKDIIVETDIRPNIDQLEKIYIKTMEDMVDLENELRLPIIAYELVQNKRYMFIIIHDNMAYLYILRSENINIIENK